MADVRPLGLLEDDAPDALSERAEVVRCLRSVHRRVDRRHRCLPELDYDVSESAALHDPELESLGQGLVRPCDEVVAEPKLVADWVELGELLERAGA